MPPVWSKPSGEVDWKKIALIVAPIVTVGFLGYLCYRSRASSSSTEKPNHPRVSGVKDPDRTLSDTDISDLPPLERAITLKNRGNKYFKGGNYEKAVECYSQAIDGCPSENAKDLSTFYQNRAAANENLRKITRSIEDCTAALKLEPRYLKAMSRRARLYENEKKMKEALEDVTALCILEGFNNVESLQRADRVLKALGESLSKEEMPKKTHQLPSAAFLRTYFSSFCHDPFLNPPEPPDGHVEQTGDGEHHLTPAETTLQQAIEKLVNGSYEEVIELSEKAVTDLKSENHKRLPEGFLLRGSFRLLRGDAPGALADMEAAAVATKAPSEVRTTALIRKGSLIMTTRSDIEESLAEFTRALDISKENSDIYHHRGQLYLICDKLDQAVADLNKAASLSPDFSIAQAQKAYASYRAAQSKQNLNHMQSAIQELNDLTNKYPLCIETHSLYSQVLVDLGRFDEADRHFQKIIDLEPHSGTAYVHRGLLHLQWKQDVDGAIDLMRKAINMDSRCEFAHETLATVYVQRGDFDEALMLFAKAIQLCRTENEMAHLISLREAVVAQQRVCGRLGLSVQDLIKQNMRNLHGQNMGGIPVPV